MKKGAHIPDAIGAAFPFFRKKEIALKILLIDDEPSAFELLTFIIGDERGISIDYCEDLNEGLINALDPKYNIILSDMRFPGSDCEDTMKRICEVSEKVCTIMWTNHFDAEMILWSQSIEAGALNFLQKELYLDARFAAGLIHALTNSFLVFNRRVKNRESSK